MVRRANTTYLTYQEQQAPGSHKESAVVYLIRQNLRGVNRRINSGYFGACGPVRFRT